jgi:hypothetical protein
VQWSLYEDLLTREPFRDIDKMVMTPQGPKRIRVNAEYDTDDWDEPLRIVKFFDYLLWRNVGLRGELPDGRPGPSRRGRNGERNALFADSLVYTGMRLGEGSSMLVTEVPPVYGVQRVMGDVHLSAGSKRSGSRAKSGSRLPSAPTRSPPRRPSRNAKKGCRGGHARPRGPHAR